MKEFTPDKIRNVALIGHGSSGKTILADAMLMASGAATRIGSIVDGSTVSDYHSDEIDRQISINSTLLSTEFMNHKLNILDTPGYNDFIGDVISSLRVVDSALLVLKAVEGVEVGSELVWRYAAEAKVPVVIAVNKMDNEHADFDRVYEEAKARFGPDLIIAQFPVNKGPNFNACIDVVRKKLMTFSTDGSGKYTESEVPAEFTDRIEAEHQAMLEKVAESSEDLLEKFFENGTLSDDELALGFKMAIRDRKIFPIFCMAGELNIGVGRMMEFFINYGPDPITGCSCEALKSGTEETLEITPDANGNQVAAFVFKTISEPHVGELSLFRVYNGTVSAGSDMVNQTNGKSERLNQMYALRGKERFEVSKVPVGDIAAVVKLKDTHTNNTLSSKGYEVQIPPIAFPEPVMSSAVKSKAKGDEDKIGTGLHTLHEEDPAFQVKVDSETGETIVLGQGEIHINVMTRRLKERFGVEVDLFPPKIPYRETIRKHADVSYRHKKQTGGAGQYAEVYIKLDPQPRGEGYEFADNIVGGVISGRFIPAVDKGIQELMSRGVVAGCKMVDLKVTLYDGSQHTVDSNEMAFKVAAQQAFRKAVSDAKPMLLEPIYDITVTVPDEFMGDVMGDISTHRGKIQGMDAEGPFQVIRAKVPLSELYNYATRLRSITQGRGIYRRAFSNYEEVPNDVQEKIVAEYKAAKEEDN
ncbi:MAG: elongation factor G [Ignavibacteria bacterium]|nr:MAG: elongation factor G [Ignavibacteria bacterium]